MGWYPCCCDSSPVCYNLMDDYNRSDSTNIDGTGSDEQYTEVVGDWEISSNQLYIDSTNAECQHDNFDLDISAATNNGVAVDISASGAKAGIQFNNGFNECRIEYDAINNKLAYSINGTVTKDCDCSSLTTLTVVALNCSIPTQISSASSGDAFLIFVDGVYQFMVFGADTFANGSTTLTLFTGDTVGTSVTFDNLTSVDYVTKPATTNDNDPCVGCVDCCWPAEDTENPSSVSLTIAGSSYGGDGTYSLPLSFTSGCLTPTQTWNRACACWTDSFTVGADTFEIWFQVGHNPFNLDCCSYRYQVEKNSSIVSRNNPNNLTNCLDDDDCTDATFTGTDGDSVTVTPA